MTDIVERLRELNTMTNLDVLLSHIEESADEIEKLRFALQEIADAGGKPLTLYDKFKCHEEGVKIGVEVMANRARKALNNA